MEDPYDSKITVKIESTEEATDGKSTWTVYNISVDYHRAKWNLKKRYSEFRSVWDKFKTKEPEKSQHIKIPPKKVVGNRDPGFIQERRVKLEKFLQLWAIFAPESPFVIEFLEINQNRINFKEAHPGKTSNAENFLAQSRQSIEKAPPRPVRRLPPPPNVKKIDSVALMNKIKNVPAPEDLPRHSNDEQDESIANQREKVLEEILSTEKAYLQFITLAVEKYKKPLEEAIGSEEEIIDADTIANLFSNLEQIRGVSKSLLDRLIEVGPDSVGKAILELSPFFRIYLPYVNNFQHALDVYAKLRSKNTDFVQFEKESEKESGGLSLLDLLIMPIQRVPRIKLLLESLQKATPLTASSSGSVISALQSVGKICDEINSERTKVEELEKVTRVQRLLTGDFKSIVRPHRKFLKEAPVKLNVRKTAYSDEGRLIGQFYCFMFNDILIISKQQFLLKQYQHLRTLLVDYLDEVEITENTLTMSYLKDADEMTFTFASEIDAKAWMKLLETQIKQRREQENSKTKKLGGSKSDSGIWELKHLAWK